jgi:hypothetical protein
MSAQVWVPKTLTNLPPLLVLPNGTPQSYRVRPLDQYQWQEWPEDRLGYYRPATDAEARELLPEAA